ncbi:dTDP-4-dehydrorhamnose 3,5-epimerase [Aeromonas sp. A35_P]|uniref:dTDP-4-dehydrorhamnose 3,5-epimerase n=1 Tax=Aeromonas sp. A35_P TaxID=1983805 RepID=UPI000B9A3B36|nr:dTDP-4-dehydrorhamnose 3,5-epimerase [Aeromonas sp. A35_P]OZG43605.1 dTDP-4-dehydrorhamnose 3,5-epimerase [Aeromonas sp. A35_P]
MHFISLKIPDVVQIIHQRHYDERGDFMELFRHDLFTRRCGDFGFVQDNLSRSRQGTLRGLHYQRQKPQGKLVQVIAGTIFDVAVDLREKSTTYGKWVGARLSAAEGASLWIPPGFAHGFYVMSEEAHVLYKCTDYYAPELEATLNWSDPTLAIEWPILDQVPLILSAKDRNAPFWL